MVRKYLTAAMIGLLGLAAAFGLNSYATNYFREQRELELVKSEGIRLGTDYYNWRKKIHQSNHNFCKSLYQIGDTPVKYREISNCLKV